MTFMDIPAHTTIISPGRSKLRGIKPGEIKLVAQVRLILLSNCVSTLTHFPRSDLNIVEIMHNSTDYLFIN